MDELAELEAELEAELAEENKSSPLFDGRYSFNLLRYHDDEDWQELGSGFVEIKNGEIMIDKDNSDLKTGSTELYDTFSGQINKKGKISASTELDILGGGVDRSEVYNLSGQIDEKIWGDSPREDFFRVYMRLEVVDTIKAVHYLMDAIVLIYYAIMMMKIGKNLVVVILKLIME